MELTIGLIGTIVAIISSLIVEFWAKWQGFKYKRQIMLALNFLVPIVIWLLVCPAQLPIKVEVACTTEGLLEAVGIGIVASLSNQGVWNLAGRPLRRKIVTYKLNHKK